MAWLCRALGVSRSGLYGARRKTQRPRARENARRGQRAATLFEESGRTYGARRLAAALRRARGRAAADIAPAGSCAAGACAPLKYAGCPKQKRRFRPRTTDSHHLCPIAPNRLAARSAPPTRPDEVGLR